ncbi:MAG TPA: cysteine dioxygenase family protein [Terriglobales bacterium]|nr:cysteine dioxygenase family protein [Terriglobales bacterium]
MVLTSQKSQTLLVQEFASELRKLPSKAFNEVPTVHEFLRTHRVDADSLAPYLVWDRQHYTRNLIDKTPLYELIAICWEVGQASSIHNHRDQNCWMAAPIGKLLIQNYHVVWQDEDAGKCKIEPTNIIEMNPQNPAAVDPLEPVHRVYNPAEFSQRAVSLHVYSRPFDSCVVYSDQQGTCGTIKLHYTTEYGKKN